MVCFQTQNPNLAKFWRLENVDMFYGHLEYVFMDNWDILLPFGTICVHLVQFVFIWYILLGFGIMHQEKSGSPARNCFFLHLRNCGGRGGGVLLVFYLFSDFHVFLLRINRFSSIQVWPRRKTLFRPLLKSMKRFLRNYKKKLFDAPKLFSYVTFYFLKHNHLLPGAYPTKSYKYWFTNICNILHFCYF
jgi:hypothetical protein